MAKAKGGLGKGFGALLGESLMAAEEESGGVSTLPMPLVEPNREQPRKRFSPETMQELTRSIEMHVVVTPITVRKTENGYYQIIAGERRWRAARSAGLTEIPALVIEADDKTVMELALIENLQREDLNPIEEAQGYHSLMEEYGLTQSASDVPARPSRTPCACCPCPMRRRNCSQTVRCPQAMPAPCSPSRTKRCAPMTYWKKWRA